MKRRHHRVCIICKHRCVSLKACHQRSWDAIRITPTCHCRCKCRHNRDRGSTRDIESLCKWRRDQWTRVCCCCSRRNSRRDSHSHIGRRWHRGSHPHDICRNCTTDRDFLWTLRNRLCIGCRSGTSIRTNHSRKTFTTSQSHTKINSQVFEKKPRTKNFQRYFFKIFKS